MLGGQISVGKLERYWEAQKLRLVYFESFTISEGFVLRSEERKRLLRRNFMATNLRLSQS